MIMIPVLLYAQIEYTHPLPNNIATLGAKKIKAMEEDRALIFSIDYQPNRIDNYIIKVDYDGNELFSIQINIDNYNDVMLIEGIEHDGGYILIGTAVDASDKKPYFITVLCESDLTRMRIADRHSIQYPVFTSFYSAKIQNDSDTGHYGFVFNTGPWKDQTREMLFASFDIEGQIYSFDSFDNGSLFIDHIYSSNTKKHYIVAGKKSLYIVKKRV